MCSLPSVSAANGWDISSTLVYFANHAAGYKGHLVIGAMGMTSETEPKMDRLGHVASTCLAKAKVSLLSRMMISQLRSPRAWAPRKLPDACAPGTDRPLISGAHLTTRC